MKTMKKLVSVFVIVCMALALFTGFAGAAGVAGAVQQTLKSAAADKGFDLNSMDDVHFVDAGREGDAVTASLPHDLAVSGRSVAVAVVAVDKNGSALAGHETRFVLGTYSAGRVTVTYQETGCRYFAMMPIQSFIEQGTIHRLSTDANKAPGGMYDIYVEAALCMSDDLAEYVVVNKTDERLLNMRFTCYLENDVINAGHNAELNTNFHFEDPHGIYELLEDETYATDGGLVIKYKLDRDTWSTWRYTGAAQLKEILQTEVVMTCNARESEAILRPAVNYDNEIWTYGTLELTYEVNGVNREIPAVSVETFLLPAKMDYIVLDGEPTHVPGHGGYPGVGMDEEDWLDEDDRVLPGIPAELNGKDHVAYIIGYEGDVVRPNNNITRAEVATIFFRLLQENVRNAYMTQDNDFSDVSEGQWFNCAISTMSDLGVLKGYPDGTFRPNAPITRAEFAAIAARFDGREPDGMARFTDIRGHWGAEEISRAYQNCWVDGYPDGTFRPDRDITRAEAMTLVNRVLHRDPETSADLLPDMVIWNDNRDESAWYYLAVQEATNSHDYHRKSNSHENWDAIEAVPDWSALEK